MHSLRSILVLALALMFTLASSCEAVRHHRPCVTPSTPMHDSVKSQDSSSSCVLPAGFVHLSDVAPSVIQEMRYGTMHNFMGRIVDEYVAPRCILTTQAAIALSKVQNFLLSGAADPVSGTSYSLKMYDCYRPTGAVADFVSWSQNISDTLMQAEFYPEQNKADLFAEGYIALKSGHSRGSTMDLTIVALPAAAQPTYVPGVTKLVSCHAPWGVRWQDNSIDMGTGFDCG